MAHWTQVYWQGKAAWPQARDNPWPSDTTMASAWYAGWDKAEREAREAEDLEQAKLTLAKRIAGYTFGKA